MLCALLWAHAGVVSGAEAGVEVEAEPSESPESPPGSPESPPVSTEDIISRARDFLGGDEALDKVKSLRLTGSVLLADGTSGDLELIVQKSVQQRLTLTIGNTREITALSGYDAWRRVETLDDPPKWEIMLLEPDRIRELRAQFWENIGFFHGIEKIGGRLEMRGEEMVDEVPCVKVAFIHGKGLEFLRYFNKETGQLMFTKGIGGEIIRESGSIMKKGIRFPKELERTGVGPKSIVIFSDVFVNEKFDNELFEVPLMVPSSKP